MKKYILIYLSFLGIFYVFLSESYFSFAEDKDPLLDKQPAQQASPKKKEDDTLFVVATDEESAAESLNRVSGDIDLGFSSPEQTYKSTSHTKLGAYQRSEEKSADTASYSY